MKKLLIVEDEKMIRQGIVTMVKRIPITIEEIIQCKNGVEALEILYSQPIDLMITDIRMPKMDGIQLVKEIQHMEHKPQILVISGYDDFNYAVEVLRQGVRDYLLKPIERNKLSEVLTIINKEIEYKKEEFSVSKQIGNQQLKYIILNQKINEEEIQATNIQFSTFFPHNRYLVGCINSSTINERNIENIIVLNQVNNFTVIVVEEDKLNELLNNELKEYSIGISSVKEDLSNLREAFLEAVIARKQAFVKCVNFCYYNNSEFQYESIPDDFSEHFVQQFSNIKIESSLSKLSNLRLKAKMNKISSEKLLSTIDEIVDKLLITYEKVIEINMSEFNKIKNSLHHINIEVYFIVLEDWLFNIQKIILEEFDDYKNKEKINSAIQYIRENFSSDLNMAVVSNYISMNYSLFSLNFKLYTGMNFVNYLKKIRIDEAKRLLQETEDKIIVISQRIGYDNEKHFMKTFKSVCGVSPSEYRKNIIMSKNKKTK